MRVLAHRGLATGGRENTLAAFSAARRQGADGVELDVRLSADGAVVVHHDPVIEGCGPVSELKVADMPEWVPLLGAALEVCEGMVVNVEIKQLEPAPGWEPTEALAREVAALVAERAVASAVVSSFSFDALGWVRSCEPTVATGWLTLPGQDQSAALETVAEAGCDALHPHHLAVTEALVGEAHALGIEVGTWTVDDPGLALDLCRAGVDTLISNRPDLVIEALRG